MTLIDNCDVEKLILSVQCRRPIYDNSAKEHGSRGLIEHLWNEIAEEMNAPVSKCKAKWQQLRNSFVRSYRGTSGYGKKRKKWYLHDALSFMEEHIQLHKLDDTVYTDSGTVEDYDIEEKNSINNSNVSSTPYNHSNYSNNNSNDHHNHHHSQNPHLHENSSSNSVNVTTTMYPSALYFQQHQQQQHEEEQRRHQQLNHEQYSPTITLIDDNDERENLNNPHHHEHHHQHLHHNHHQSHGHHNQEINETNNTSEDNELPLLPKLKPMPSSQICQTIPTRYLASNIPLNVSNITANNPNTTSSPQIFVEENPLLNFCKGILPEFDRLSSERQRKFKTEILNQLNHHLDEQEKEIALKALQASPSPNLAMCNFNKTIKNEKNEKNNTKRTNSNSSIKNEASELRNQFKTE